MPIAGGLLSGLGFIGLASLELFVVYVVSRLTRGFSQRLWLAIVVVVALECAAALVQGRSNLAGALVAGVIAGVAAASVLLLLLRYDPRLVPAFAATVVLMTGVVKAAQAGAWLPFAVDAVATIAVAAWLTRYLMRDPRARRVPKARAHLRASIASLRASRLIGSVRNPMSNADRLLMRVRDAMFADERRLRARIERARARQAHADEWQRIAGDVERALAVRASRVAGKPRVTYPPELPVVAARRGHRARRFASTRSSSCPAKRAPARRRSCRRSASTPGAASAG